MSKESISPLSAALEAAGIAGSLFTGLAGLGLATAGIAVAGVATVGLAAWFLAKREKMNQVLIANNLTPKGPPYSCGSKENSVLTKTSKTR